MDQLIADLIATQAGRTPEACAISEGYRQLTYSELDARANQLAHLLLEKGVGTETVVALCARRSQEFIIGALGILKAGAAYLPLDPDYPAGRLAMLLADSGAKLVVAHSSSTSLVPQGGWETIVLDPASASTAGYSRVAPRIDLRQDNLAYVIYTSGSTGRPKGVEVTHANLMNLVRWHQRAFAVSAADRSTFLASPGFDAAVWEVWPYLAAGATLHIVDERVRTAPDGLRDWMLANGITISFLPTALAEPMLDLAWPREKTNLRYLLTGADTLHRRPPKGLPFVFVNNYGPTEGTVVSTSGIIAPDNGSSEAPSIGCAIDNVSLYVVDENMRQIPAGEAGELLIAGANLARGYRSLPEITAQKFIPNPFSTDPRSRLYRTGDLVRLGSNGEIAFLGRIDDQIKIRGYRIEPEEINLALKKLAAVESSIVVAHGEGYGEKRLLAYLVARAGATLNARTIRQELAGNFPDYMIPAVFVELEKLPVSVNGKLDRAALPAPAEGNTLHDDAYEAPESELQERLAAIVASLLGVPRIGLDDNFFNLGGHSLLGAQLIARISDTFGVEMSLLSVFDDPSVRGMAAEIERLFLAKLENMTEDEAQRLLSAQTGS